ncbi:site-specific integrase [Paenibacillus xylanexedens]|uniref:tyrosine-type recombinase/integrase n=1 Tax=Paenibacillus xylanexedens TaxID=528191 RepID=UPI00119D7CC3|nr:site-specific integrase [Paenibacillus xylanexedens]
MASYTKIKANNKQGYKWICTLEGPPDPVTGKRKQIPRRGDTQKEALARAQKIVDDLTKHGVDAKKVKNLTFEQVKDEWLEDYAKTKNVKKSTVSVREGEIKIILRYYAKVKIDKLTHNHHQNMLNQMFEEGYSQSSLQGVDVTAKMIIKYAIKHKMRADNPFADTVIPVKLLTVEEIESDPIAEKILEKHELAEFLLAVKEHGLPMDLEIFHLLAFSGLRSGELCALKDTDFFLETNELRVTKTLYCPKNNVKNYMLTPPKTKGSIRRFDVIEDVMRGIASHLDRMRSQRIAAKKLMDDYHDENFVFARSDGYPFITKKILKRMDRLLLKTSITKRATPHIFRHTHISMLAEAEVDLKTIMERVGHDDAKTTLKIYTHVTKNMKKNATERIMKEFSDILQI